MKNIWSIPRTDKRDRCGKCLKVFDRYKKEWKYFRREYRNLWRFPNLCETCYNKCRISMAEIKTKKYQNKMATLEMDLAKITR